MFFLFREREILFGRQRVVLKSGLIVILFAREALSAADFSFSIGPRKRSPRRRRDHSMNEKERVIKRFKTARSMTTQKQRKRFTNGKVSLSSKRKEREKERATKPRDLSEEAASPREKKRNKKKERGIAHR